ncbi:MAG: BON domain-containing protein [Gammaproteobacteria bacterium]|jgi:osmotically-inducible protein OsmY|nr:BON domain-containing protein [Gammaproteobacteria bacterium]MBT6043451.1 BON domain-containing protein [Gammaproteobacteria bacterium]
MLILRLGFFFSILLLLNGCATVISATTGDDGVQEDKGRRSMGAMVDDSSIETSIKVNLNAADELLKKAHINVVSFNGTVLLVGQVPSQEMKNLATRVTRTSSSRVKEVYNELEVAGTTTFLSRSNDAWLTAKIKTLMLADREVSSFRTKVITENGVVYLMGLLSEEEATTTVNLVSNTRGVTKVVRAFEYIN